MRDNRGEVEHAQLLRANVNTNGVWDAPGTIFLTPAYAESNYGDDAERGFEEAIATALEELGEVGDGVVIVKNLAQGNPSKVLHDAALSAVSLVTGSHGHQGAFPGMHPRHIARTTRRAPWSLSGIPSRNSRTPVPPEFG